MKQKPLFPLRSQGLRYKPERQPHCYCCRAPLTHRQQLLAWREFKRLVRVQHRAAAVRGMTAFTNEGLQDIELHPDLLFALKQEAGFHRLTLSDMLNQILEGYFEAEFDRLVRRKGRRYRGTKVERRFFGLGTAPGVESGQGEEATDPTQKGDT